MAAPNLTDALNRNCLCIGADVPSLRAWLERDLRDHGLTDPILQTHPHLFSAAPLFVSERHIEQMRALIHAVETVIATQAYAESVLKDAPPIARVRSGASGVFFGYDFHLCDSGPQLIEINSNAGGAMLNVALSRAQRACCAEVESQFRAPATPDALERGFIRMFEHEWQASRGNRKLTSIAIVDDDPTRQYLYPEFLMFQRLFEAHGLDARVVDAQELRYENNAVLIGDRPIDLIYNRLTDFYLQEPHHAVLAKAHVDGAVLVTPDPRAHALYGNKHNLTLLTNEHELRAMRIGEAAIETLLSGIPVTRAVSAADELQWWNERKQWFFKPVHGFGSKGSYRGDKLTRKTFADILQRDYVAQRVVPPSERWLGSGQESYPLKVDLRNYVYKGEIQLLAARLYQGQTTNFRTSGGGFAPVYIAPEQMNGACCA